MNFMKMHGLGNDFVVFSGPLKLTSEQVVNLCDRRTGIGADGVLVVTPADEDVVQMEYWNADGSFSEMCGNGLRCVARYAVDRGWLNASSFEILTRGGQASRSHDRRAHGSGHGRHHAVAATKSSLA